MTVAKQKTNLNKVMKKLLQIIPVFATAALLVFAAGCQTAGPAHKQGFDFNRYHTFAILPVVTTGTYQDPTLVTRLQRPVTDTVVETLTGKGFKRVAGSEADFQVNLRFNYWGQDSQAETRMFDLQIIDAKTKEIVWSDYWSRTTVDTLSQEAICKHIAGMMKPFPPGSH